MFENGETTDIPSMPGNLPQDELLGGRGSFYIDASSLEKRDNGPLSFAKLELELFKCVIKEVISVPISN